MIRLSDLIFEIFNKISAIVFSLEFIVAIVLIIIALNVCSPRDTMTCELISQDGNTLILHCKGDK